MNRGLCFPFHRHKFALGEVPSINESYRTQFLIDLGTHEYILQCEGPSVRHMAKALHLSAPGLFSFLVLLPKPFEFETVYMRSSLRSTPFSVFAAYYERGDLDCKCQSVWTNAEVEVTFQVCTASKHTVTSTLGAFIVRHGRWISLYLLLC